ncbi:MAG: excinuclease ABC subunit UvrC [Saccharofermentans sp.]|nr:excinuclease ABC subunit UvrC [Saccharofermentans sp.]
MKDSTGAVIYVGKAKKLRNRLKSYFGGGVISSNKVAAMVSHVADFEYTVVGSESEALLLENNLIKRYQPKYNILLRDDKGYPYICITLNELYPRVFKAFRPDPKLRQAGAVYYGPYMNGDCYEVLQTINDIFPLKRCKKVFPRDIGKERPCLNYHIGKCMAPCRGEVKSEDYRAMTDKIVMFFEGKYKGIEESIEDEMRQASSDLEFEKAGILRDRLIALRNVSKDQRVYLSIERDVDAIGLYSDAGETCIRKLELRSGRVVGSSTYFVSGTEDDREDILKNFILQYYETSPKIPPVILVPDQMEDREDIESFLTTLAGRKISLHKAERGELYDLAKLAASNAREMMVRRILRGGGAGADPTYPLRYLEELMGAEEGSISRAESFDISNLGNDDICAGMVVFKDGKPDKSSYRLFKMKMVETQDDFASMRETLTRRFAHLGQKGFEAPDIILVDGGQGQLTAVASVVRSIEGTEGIKLAGMFKNDRHKTAGIIFEDGRQVKLEGKDLTDSEISLLRFLTTVQNEVHRFAISYQHKLATKRNIRYKLEAIDGIGPAKRKNLLAHFGTIKGVEGASIEQLGECKGISGADAKAIYRFFHGEE